MFFVFGLGNPESRYSGTRHNVGFEVVDCLARELQLPFKAGRGEFLIAQGNVRDQQLAVVKPLTYMNESGLAVMEIQEQYELQQDHMLVVCDDSQLPLGQLRLRLSGSDGGHNGLCSIIYHLQSDDFPRLRCGIASPTMPSEKSLLADFVLQKFTPEEQPVAQKMIECAKDACLSACTEGLTTAMNVFNRKQISDTDTSNE